MLGSWSWVGVLARAASAARRRDVRLLGGGSGDASCDVNRTRLVVPRGSGTARSVVGSGTLVWEPGRARFAAFRRPAALIAWHGQNIDLLS